MKTQLLKNLQIDESEVSKITNEICEGMEGLYLTDCLPEEDFEDGKLVFGKVVDKREKHILIDVRHRFEGLLPMEEDGRSNQDLDIGDEVKAIVSEFDEDEDKLVLSRVGIEDIEARLSFLRNITVGQRLVGTISSIVPEGVVVKIDCVEALLPKSELFLPHLTSFESLKGSEIDVEVIEFTYPNSISLSRRNIVAEYRKSEKEAFLSIAAVGVVVSGIVKSLTHLGAFIQLASGVMGLCHTSDFGSEKLQEGQVIDVKILKIDKEKKKFSLGIKQLNEKSWDQLVAEAIVTNKVSCKITSLVPYGAFAEIIPGLFGMIHISDLSWSDHVKHPKDVLSVGQEITAVVLEIDPEKRRIYLGYKQNDPNPWILASQKYLPGSSSEAVVVNKTANSLVVELCKGVEGQITTKKAKNMNVGDKLTVIILKIDPNTRSVSLVI